MDFQVPQDSIATGNPYMPAYQRLLEAFGEPDWELTIPGMPRGFTVARKKERTAGTAKSYLWAQEARAMLQHVYDIEHLTATQEHPLFFWTEAWFSKLTHCDPENTHKLAKDALFYLCQRAKDKYTSGCYAGPLYDWVDPRTEIKVWRLTMPKPTWVPTPIPEPIAPTKADRPPGKLRVPKTKLPNPFTMIDVKSKKTK